MQVVSHVMLFFSDDWTSCDQWRASNSFVISTVHIKLLITTEYQVIKFKKNKKAIWIAHTGFFKPFHVVQWNKHHYHQRQFRNEPLQGERLTSTASEIKSANLGGAATVVAKVAGNRLYRLNWFVCFYDCVLVPCPRAPWIAIGLTARKWDGVIQ